MESEWEKIQLHEGVCACTLSRGYCKGKGVGGNFASLRHVQGD